MKSSPLPTSAASRWSSPACAISGTRSQRILGIDPGLRITGFGVVDAEGGLLRYVASGVIRTGVGSVSERIGRIHAGIVEIVATYRPELAVCEIVFVNVNPKSTLLLGQARGAAIGALVSQSLPVCEYTALQVKQAVVGYGRATKQQMQQMTQRLLTLPQEPSPDAADALGCVICHVHGQALTARFGRKVKRGRIVG